MHYLFLAYHHREAPHSVSENTQQLLVEAAADNDIVLRERGSLLLAAHLPGFTPTATVSIRNGEVSVGTETVPPIGVYLMYANDMNDAIRTASNMPQARLGTIEIWALERVETF